MDCDLDESSWPEPKHKATPVPLPTGNKKLQKLTGKSHSCELSWLA
jgi:hypothetical protein